MQAAGTIAPWDEFWDSYFEWELEPVDNTVRIRTDLAAVSEDSAYASTHDVYELWPRLRCPGPVGPSQQAHGPRRRPGGFTG